MRDIGGKQDRRTRGRIMGLSLLHAAVCGVSLGGCGGGGGGADGATAISLGAAGGSQGVASAPAPAPVPAPVPAPPPATGLAFSFGLPAARTTSAGVYAADGTLVRTLWRGERLAAGNYSRHWDQRDDAGTLLPAGSYTVKVAHHDVQYVWEGAIGNTSSRAGSAVLHHSYRNPTSLAATAGGMLYAVGYNEAQSALNGFALSRPQLNQSPVRLIDPFISAGMVAADGQRVYWANTGQAMTNRTFIGAYDQASGAPAAFPAGSAVCLNLMADGKTCYAAQSYTGVLDLRSSADDPATGLAVQAAGNLLAVAYGAEGVVRLFDKSSGQLVRSLAVALAPAGLNQIAMTPGGDLWVIAGTTALRYSGLATAPVVAATVTGLARPLAIAADPHDENAVWIADGGASQQLKRFDRSGLPQQTVGRAGGLGGQTAVAADTLCFALNPDQEQTAVAIDDTHAVWVVDTCNNRMLKFATDGHLADQIAWLPASYAMSVDAGNPTRVFANYLEFSLDYGKPMTDPAAWTLVRNWLPSLPATMRRGASAHWTQVSANWGWTGFRTVLTMSNGRTYGLLGVGAGSVIVELTAGGSLRPVATLRDAAPGETNVVLYENGDLGWSASDGATQTVLRTLLKGFDANGNPVWAANPTVLASAPVAATAPTLPPLTFTGVVGARFPVTASGKVVYFNAAVDAGSGFHLGAVDRGGNAWRWRASPSGPLDGLGTFQTKKDDTTLQYGGNLVHANGRSIVYGYHGEYFTDLLNHRQGEANQFMHFLDDGLFVGQFGVASTRATSAAQPGLSGNAFSSTLLAVGGQTYLFHNDESTFGGVHRWRLQGANDIQELSASGATGAALTLH